MARTALVEIFHLTNERKVNVRDGLSVMTGLLDGEYYLAGTVEVERSDLGETDAAVLEQAWLASENDRHANLVTFPDGSSNTYQAIMTAFDNDYEAAERDIKRRGGEVHPAVWNGEFAQRSSKVGDVFMIEGQLYVAAGIGFERLAYGETANTLVGNLCENPWKPAPQPRSEFDALVFIGD